MQRAYFLLAAAAALFLPCYTHAQQLEALGVAGSFNLTQTRAQQREIAPGQFLIRTDTDEARWDDTGNRLSAYARFGFGQKGFFVQPELAYTSTLGNQYQITDFSRVRPDMPWPDEYYFAHRLRRGELAALAGLHLGRAYVLAGPLLAVNLREEHPAIAGQSFGELYRQLYGSVRRVQALGQLGVGRQLWRFDVQARYEHSLTPYTRQFTYQGQRFSYRQRTNQLVFGLGFLLYDRSRQR